VKDDDVPYLQVLVRDADEQENLKHILMKLPFILCFDQFEKRYYGQYASQDEKTEFK
jgi:hypothetical protein